MLALVHTALITLLASPAQFPALPRGRDSDDGRLSAAAAREARLALATSQRAESAKIERWLVLPEGQALDVRGVLARYALDPDAAPPVRAGAEPDAGWSWSTGASVPRATACFATFHVPRDQVRMLRLEGAPLVFVNGVPAAGDPEHRGYGGVPVALPAGDNHLLVVGPCADTTLELWLPRSRLVVATWDVRWKLGSDGDVEYPVFNASVIAAGYMHVHYDNGEWNDGFKAAPLGFAAVEHYANDSSAVPVRVYAGADPEPDNLRLVRRDSQRLPDARATTRASQAAGQSVSSRIANLVADDPRALYLVYGTQGSAEETDALRARARLDQQLLSYSIDDMPELVDDCEYRTALPRGDSNKRPAVLYGNADTNAAWSAQCPLVAHRGSLSIGDEVFRGDDVTGWCVYRADDGTARAVLADSGVRATRASVLLQPLTNTVSGRTRAIYRVKDAALACIASD
jgi:hypothetical protein